MVETSSGGRCRPARAPPASSSPRSPPPPGASEQRGGARGRRAPHAASAAGAARRAHGRADGAGVVRPLPRRQEGASRGGARARAPRRPRRARRPQRDATVRATVGGKPSSAARRRSASTRRATQAARRVAVWSGDGGERTVSGTCARAVATGGGAAGRQERRIEGVTETAELADGAPRGGAARRGARPPARPRSCA